MEYLPYLFVTVFLLLNFVALINTVRNMDNKVEAVAFFIAMISGMGLFVADSADFPRLGLTSAAMFLLSLAAFYIPTVGFQTVLFRNYY